MVPLCLTTFREHYVRTVGLNCYRSNLWRANVLRADAGTAPRLLVVLSACSPLAWHTSAPGESNLHLSVVNCRHGTLENNTHTALAYLPACANDVGIQMQMDTTRLSFWACYTSVLHRLVFKQSRRHKINRLAGFEYRASRVWLQPAEHPHPTATSLSPVHLPRPLLSSRRGVV